jgi:hypothetical protein
VVQDKVYGSLKNLGFFLGFLSRSRPGLGVCADLSLGLGFASSISAWGGGAVVLPISAWVELDLVFVIWLDFG